ncbi:lactate dehydrogenase [Pseudomonas huanghezhanensis]|uniref:lactate dehydrogenase n=1 Tax=Pseudomonas huanghezhanensis TaxID=3002903 RepID=UPI002285BB91|nr:lactate dehydrogenase [Pseudomonas sp. BSw22131]
MTSISAVSQGQLLALKPATALAPAVNDEAGSTQVSSPASVVLLGQQSAVQSALYSSRGLLPGTEVSLAWEAEAVNKVSAVMSGNFAVSATAGRFQGLGAALLKQLASNGSDYSQSLVRSNGALQTAELSAAQLALHGKAENSITLTIKTASGATVSLNLSSKDNGLAVSADVTGGTLNDDELAGLASLADGFQSAIDGLSSNPPALNLDKLTQYDTSVFSSIDLKAQLKGADGTPQTLSFRADSAGRSVDMTGSVGSFQLSLDLQNSAILGNADQQEKALQSYLKQFDSARQRGHGDDQLMTLFADTFKTLNSHYPDTSPASGAPQTVNSISLTDADHALLTGLADFSASVKARTEASNPYRLDELDAFAYQVSQSSKSQGQDQLNRTVEQTRQSHLTASYHQALYPGAALKLGTDAESQSYAYYQIEDSTSTSLRMEYDKGKLIDASVSKSVSQSTRISKYELGKLIEDTLTPENHQQRENLSSLVEAALQADTKSRLQTGRSTLADALASIRERVMQPQRLS